MTLKEIFEKEVKSKNQQSTDVELLFLTSNEHYINWIEKAVNENQTKADKWDKLDEEIGRFYESDWEYADFADSEAGDLADIGEISAMVFGYL